MQISKETAEKKLAGMNMKDMPLMNITPSLCTVSPDWFKTYKKLCREFMSSLTDSVQELVFMNIKQDDFMELIMGRKLPENLSIRFRIPLVWGGKLELENLFMCRTFPQSHNLDLFIIDQQGNDNIWLPNPAKKVYVPTHTASGGDGGNATEDRLSQLAAQLANDRDI